MPNRNGTGPMGRGAATGGARGGCVPGEEGRTGGRFGFRRGGCGNGNGGGRGVGRGIGFGVRPEEPVVVPNGGRAASEVERELDELRKQVLELQARLDEREGAQ